MTESRLEDYVLGWIVGNFHPAVRRTDQFEIAIKEFQAGDCEPQHSHKEAGELIAVLCGTVRVRGTALSAGKISYVPPGEQTDLVVLEDSKCLFIKTVGKNDRIWKESMPPKKYAEWMNVRKSKYRIYIVTYKRNDILNRNLHSLWESVSTPEQIDVTILANHPEIHVDTCNQRENLRIIPNYVRSTIAWGNLAKDWNFALLDCFKNWTNPDGVNWCILAQNDVEWLSGWLEYLRENREYDMISQPCGDQAIAINSVALNTIGFFDERFSTLHLHEQDFFTRAIRFLGNRVSINDGHRAGGESDYNPVGNVLTKTAMNFIDYQHPEFHHYRSMSMLGKLLANKYGLKAPNDIFRRSAVQEKWKQMGNTATEYNWYPFFWEGYEPIRNTFLYND